MDRGEEVERESSSWTSVEESNIVEDLRRLRELDALLEDNNARIRANAREREARIRELHLRELRKEEKVRVEETKRKENVEEKELEGEEEIVKKELTEKEEKREEKKEVLKIVKEEIEREERIAATHLDLVELEALTLKMVTATLWTGFAVHVHDGNKAKSEVFTKYVAQGKFFEGSAIGVVVKDYTTRNMGIAMALSQVFSRAMTQLTESIFEEYLRQN